jgi:hypothetical protein
MAPDGSVVWSVDDLSLVDQNVNWPAPGAAKSYAIKVRRTFPLCVGEPGASSQNCEECAPTWSPPPPSPFQARDYDAGHICWHIGSCFPR